jgi:hypothetical protein
MWGVSEPVRLLKENWKDPTKLAQELYAMFTARTPVVHEGPVTIKVRAGETALRIVQGDRDDADFGATDLGRPAAQPAIRRAAEEGRRPGDRPIFEPEPAEPRRRARWSEPESLRRGAGEPAEPVSDPETGAYAAPALEIDGPVRFKGPPPQFESSPMIWNPQARRYMPPQWQWPEMPDAPKPDEVGGGGAGTFSGKVVQQAETNKEYYVMLYPSGPNVEPGPNDTPVKVHIYELNENEEFRPGEWLHGIVNYGEQGYWCQPPIWIA